MDLLEQINAAQGSRGRLEAIFLKLATDTAPLLAAFAPLTQALLDRVGKAHHLPALRTGLADFPHPALQLGVSTTGVHE